MVYFIQIANFYFTKELAHPTEPVNRQDERRIRARRP